MSVGDRSVRMPAEPPTKPFLVRLGSDAEAVSTVIEWCRYLGQTFGTSGALCSLRYYERLDWITDDVRNTMEKYLTGLSIDELHNKKYDEPGTVEPPLESLSGTPFGAHARSLYYISQIAGHDLEGDMLRAQLAEHQVNDSEMSQPRVAMADGWGYDD